MDHDCVKRVVKNVSTLFNEQLEEILEETDKKKMVWIRKWMQRSTHEASALHLEDPHEHWMCLRLSSKSFDTLLEQSNIVILATGNRSLLHSFCVSKSPISRFLKREANDVRFIQASFCKKRCNTLAKQSHTLSSTYF
jgi:uncharacterized protein